MRPRSSSTSSSDAAAAAAAAVARSPGVGLRPRRRVRRVLVTCGWTLLCLLVADVAINLAFAYPSTNDRRPTAMQMQFEYGRSLEGKLRRMIGPNDEAADPMAMAGWPDGMRRTIAPAPAGRLGVSVYGMSFAQQVGEAAREVDPRIALTVYAGPAAPPNHSYACFLNQREGRDRNPVQVLGILASSVKGMLSLSGMTSTFERPAAFTFPRYTLNDDGTLHAIQPLIRSPRQLRAALADPPRWAAFVDQLSRTDRFYDPLLMRGGGAADGSAIAQLLRRGYAQHASRELVDSVYTAEGFGEHPEVAPVLRAILKAFARQCRADGQVPIVLLIQDRGATDALHRLLAPTLQAEQIPYVSTHDIVPTNDPANFLDAGQFTHFTHAANLRIARRLLEVIDSSTKHRATNGATLPGAPAH